MRRAAALSLALAAGSIALARCGPGDTGAAIYAVAVPAAPGGALLGAWVEPGVARRGWLVGGYVGVDPARVPDGRVGRLVRYDGGTFTTVCTTDRVLWWVAAARDADGEEVVFAAGEGGRLLRRKGGRCEELPTAGLWAEGAPTFWGLLARAPDDVWLVGGSTADGPRGVLARWDGARVTRRDDALPDDARGRNLYKIAEGALGTFVVGDGATVLRLGADGRFARVIAPTEVAGERLLTVSCDAVTPRCWAVGGASRGVVLRGDATGWWSFGADDLPALAGVWMQDAGNVFVAGAYGLTMHTNGLSAYRPTTPETTAGLHAVAGNGAVVLAVGGELATATPAQRATVLVRGDPRPSFVFDGVTYAATGGVRPTLGGGINGGQ